MTSASVEASLQVLSLIFSVLCVIRLILLRLYGVYPVFFALLCVSSVLQTSAVVYGTASRTFLVFYTGLEPVRNILYILVVWELFSVVFRNYAGLRSLSRWVMAAGAVVALIGFILSFATIGFVAYQPSRFSARVLTFERGIAFGLVIFIVIMLFFISRYPIKLPRNSVVLCMFYSVWFLGDAAVLVVGSFLSKGYRFAINDALALLEIGSYLGWALLLSKTGEIQETRIRRDISPELETALIGELDAMNELLLRAGRSISHSR
jgi:hypothetical protein